MIFLSNAMHRYGFNRLDAGPLVISRFRLVTMDGQFFSLIQLIIQHP